MLSLSTKRKLIALSGRYEAALRKHLRQGPRAKFQPARTLGFQALSLGLDTLDVARIHHGALATLEASSSRDGLLERAKIFFAEAVTPIEKTHDAAIKADAHLARVNQAVDRRTVDLAASHRSLKQSIARRQTAEEALKESGAKSKKLLEELHRLQKQLREWTHKKLTAQEDKRKKVSRALQNEIAQTFLGINVRLLILKQEAMVNAKRFKKDIARAQRLVDKAGKDIKRLAREIGKDDEK
jgi:signal transduction histidine kinase